MPPRTPWVEREFDFSFPVDVYPDLIERLRSTPDRVTDMLLSVPVDILTLNDGDRWSIQENIGHLLSVEALFLGRLDDYESNHDTLRPADMTNQRTREAVYNEKYLSSIIDAFRRERGKLVGRLESYESERFSKVTLHPRLNKPLRLVDMLYFQAEHDDHHLATMRELAERLSK